ncbi:hypothetical protein AeMF1_017375 [Aphanomyces euteiches]|nr:hypothetical protein AeMF1_017375 [Aphanomyces euteiches]KAH9187315.1 hypothetical protein AeNC1_010705 [Aphanomyces euteiches]
MHRSFTLVVLVSVATVAFHLVDDGPSVSSYTRLQSSKSATPQHLATTAVIRRLVGAPATWTESNADITDVRPSPSIPKSIQNLRSLSAEDTTAPQDEHNDTLRQRLGSKIASDVQNASNRIDFFIADVDFDATSLSDQTVLGVVATQELSSISTPSATPAATSKSQAPIVTKAPNVTRTATPAPRPRPIPTNTTSPRPTPRRTPKLSPTPTTRPTNATPVTTPLPTTTFPQPQPTGTTWTPSVTSSCPPPSPSTPMPSQPPSTVPTSTSAAPTTSFIPTPTSTAVISSPPLTLSPTEQPSPTPTTILLPTPTASPSVTNSTPTTSPLTSEPTRTPVPTKTTSPATTPVSTTTGSPTPTPTTFNPPTTSKPPVLTTPPPSQTPGTLRPTTTSTPTTSSPMTPTPTPLSTSQSPPTTTTRTTAAPTSQSPMPTSPTTTQASTTTASPTTASPKPTVKPTSTLPLVPPTTTPYSTQTTTTASPTTSQTATSSPTTSKSLTTSPRTTQPREVPPATPAPTSTAPPSPSPTFPPSVTPSATPISSSTTPTPSTATPTSPPPSTAAPSSTRTPEPAATTLATPTQAPTTAIPSASPQSTVPTRIPSTLPTTLPSTTLLPTTPLPSPTTTVPTRTSTLSTSPASQTPSGVPSSKAPPPLATYSQTIPDSQLHLSPPPSTEPRETQLSRPPTIRRSSNTTNDLTPNTTTIALLGSDSSGQRATRYFFNAVVGLTLVFLAFFHYIAIEPSFLSPDTSTGAFMAPNSWELSLFVSLMQIAALISCASVDVPHAIFVMLTDSFTWLNFLVGGTAKRSQQQQQRRLEAVAATSYDPFGLVQFALRVNIMERDLFIHAWTFFFIVIGALLVAMIAASFLTQSTARKEGLPSRTKSDIASKAFLTMAVLPLSAFSMYEVGQDSQSLDGFGSISGILALIALLAIAALILYAAVAVYRTSEVDLSKYKTKITFGVLYGNYKYESRLFFAATLCVHMLTGVLLAGVVEPSAQMILLLALHGFYLAIMLLLRPHVTTLQLAFSADAELVILVIFGLVHAMTLANRTDEQTKKALAYAVVILVCIVILLVFGRCLLRLWMYLIHDNYEAETSGNQPLAALISSNYWFEEGRETPSLVLSGAMDPHFLSEIRESSRSSQGWGASRRRNLASPI